MSTQLINVIAFANVGAGGSLAHPHGINVNGVDQVPDFVAFSASGFTAVVTDTTITVTNTGDAPASVNVWAELKHTTQRWFGSKQTQSLTPRPFIATGGGSGGSSGGGQTTVYTFQPGGAGVGPYVYSDFDTLYAALDAARTTQAGLFTIILDDSSASPVVIPGNAYDMTGVTLQGVRGPTTTQPVTTTITDGAAITALAGLVGLAITKAAGTPAINTTTGIALTIEGCTLGGGAANTEIIQIGGSSLIILRDQAFLAANAVEIGGGDTLTIFANGASCGCFSSAIVGDGTTTFNFYAGISSAQLEAQASMLGTIAVQQSVAAWHAGLGDPNGIVSAAQSATFIDDNDGTTYQNTNGSDVWTVVTASAGFNPATKFEYFEDFMAGADPTTYHVVATGGATSMLATSQLPFVGVLSLITNNTNDTIYGYVGKNQIELNAANFTTLTIEWGGSVDLFGNQGSFCARFLANSNMVPTLVGGNGDCLSFALGDDQNGNANWWAILNDVDKYDTGVANDTNYHRFKIVWTSGVGVEWFIDDVSVATHVGDPSVAGDNVFIGANCIVDVVGFAPSVTMDYVWTQMELNRP